MIRELPQAVKKKPIINTGSIWKDLFIFVRLNFECNGRNYSAALSFKMPIFENVPGNRVTFDSSQLSIVSTPVTRSKADGRITGLFLFPEQLISVPESDRIRTGVLVLNMVTGCNVSFFLVNINYGTESAHF